MHEGTLLSVLLARVTAVVLLLTLITAPAIARDYGWFTAKSDRRNLVSAKFANTEYPEAFRVVAAAMNRNIFVDFGIGGSVTLRLQDEPAEDALKRLLKAYGSPLDYRILRTTVVIAHPDRLREVDWPSEAPVEKEHLMPKDAIRREFDLKSARVSEVVKFLDSQYDRVKFIPNPTMNGFFAVGSPDDLWWRVSPKTSGRPNNCSRTWIRKPSPQRMDKAVSSHPHQVQTERSLPRSFTNF